MTRSDGSGHRVLLINGWSDDNRGDAAIVLGLVQLIEDQIGVDPSFTVVSSFARESPCYADADRHTKAVVDSMLPSPLPVLSDRSTALGRRLEQAGRIAQATVLLAAARSRLASAIATTEQRELLEAFGETRLVVAKGGHMYFSAGGLRGLLTLYQNLYPLLLAERVGVPTAIHAQSIGPIRGRASKRLLRSALRRVGAVHTREQPSRALVADLLGEDRAAFAWDTAFALPGEELPTSVAARLPERFVAITVRRWHFPYAENGADEQYQDYLAAVAAAVRATNDRLGLPVVLVPQVTGPTALEDDRVAVAELVSLLDGADATVIDEDISPGQLRDLYGRAELLIGTRFHSVILALAAGTPALAISYHGFKTTGIMERLGLDQYVFDIGSVRPSALVDALLALHAERERVACDVGGRIDQVLAESRHQIAAMLEEAGIN